MSSARIRPQVRFVRRAGKFLGFGLRTPCPQGLALADAGHAYDPFGAHPDWVVLGHAMTARLYDTWFRVRSSGHENVPARGPVILVANHSGGLPYDGAMIWTDVLRHTCPPRVVRPVGDYFIVRMPFVGEFMTRTGVVSGSAGNARALLERGEALLIFPEGVEGITRPFRQRYQLSTWSVGHVELAIRHRAPIVPIGVVGAEEQAPVLGRIPFPLFGIGYLPVMPPIPLPVRYHLNYGEPIDFGHLDPSDADRPEVLEENAERVRSAVEELIAKGRAERRGWFR